MSKRRKFKEREPRPVFAPTLSPDEIAEIRGNAVADGEEFIVALCDVAADPLAPISATVCMRMLRAFAGHS